MHSSDIENLFYRRLQELRVKKGVTARDMSLNLGQNEAYINQIENRRGFPSMTGFFYICEYLDITPSEFFNDENNNPYKEKELSLLMYQLNQKEKEFIISTMTALIKEYESFKGDKND